MKVGDKVTHIDYPRDIGLVVAKTAKYKGCPPIILVRWENASMCSRHIPSALKRVN
jgi:hypothetical protein